MKLDGAAFAGAAKPFAAAAGLPVLTSGANGAARWLGDAGLCVEDPEDVEGFAAEYRRRSGEATSLKAEDIMDVTPSEVQRVMREAGVQRLVHGHTHRPARHREPAGERIVLGDWYDQGSVVRWDEDGVDLSPIARQASPSGTGTGDPAR